MDLTLQSARMTLRGQKLEVEVEVWVNLEVHFQNGFRSKEGGWFSESILNDQWSLQVDLRGPRDGRHGSTSPGFVCGFVVLCPE